MYPLKINRIGIVPGLILSLIAGCSNPSSDSDAGLTDNQTAKPQMVVYKTASCGCCGDWVEHMEDNGFELEVHDTNELHLIKQKAGLKPGLGSCHTAFVDGYVVEGHVPASDVKRLLKEKPDLKGLTVPGMPAGANVPGMEVRPENAKFDVLGFQTDGSTSHWNHYE